MTSMQTMEIKPIKSERDYRRTLAQIERLMGAVPDTSNGANLAMRSSRLPKLGKESTIPLAPLRIGNVNDGEWNRVTSADQRIHAMKP